MRKISGPKSEKREVSALYEDQIAQSFSNGAGQSFIPSYAVRQGAATIELG